MKKLSLLALPITLAVTGCSLESIGPIEDPNSDLEQPPPVGLDRVTQGLQVEYLFDEGAGAIVNDTSGIGEPVNLTIQDPAAVEWTPGGLQFVAPTIAVSATPPALMAQACIESNQVTIEAWVTSANLEQTGPARIVTYSIDANNRNFTIGQELNAFDARLRTNETGLNGTPSLPSLPEAVTVAPIATHIVYTNDPAGISKIFINGELTVSDARGAVFEQWDPAYLFGLGNEISLDRPWLGELHLAAVYCRTLARDEVAKNFAAGF